MLNDGKRVAVLAGQGALTAREEVIALSDRLGAPVAKALLGKAVLPDDSPYTTGGIGHLGTIPSELAMRECDTVLIQDPPCRGLISIRSQVGTELGPIDFVAFARACCAAGFHVETRSELRPAIDAALTSPGPAVIEVIIDPEEPPTMPDKLRV